MARTQTKKTAPRASLKGLSWEMIDVNHIQITSDAGRRLYRARFRSEFSPRDGCYEVGVLFWARRPRIAVKSLLEQGKCPVDFHNEVLD